MRSASWRGGSFSRLKGGQEIALRALAFADAGGGVSGGFGGRGRQQRAQAFVEIRAILGTEGGMGEAGNGDFGDQKAHLGGGSHGAGLARLIDAHFVTFHARLSRGDGAVVSTLIQRSFL